ncbi:MAG TPA: hypothetical protein ENG92_04915 [Thiolapillus brandeum]|uniref:Uncharacterized protein n=1 Tax=Thiolapillus brandeum TaxID=1076588 RepID=A0A831KDD8_9GAMM|nr:hypothetical protein [Thiolapillus brandeum]
MTKMTMQEELEMLRKEVEELKQHQEQAETESRDDFSDAEALIREKLEQAGEKAEELKEEVMEQLHDLMELLKSEYENVSPVAAVLLFALGAVFGRAISSK